MFHVIANNVKLKPSARVAVTEEIRVQYGGVEFALRQGGEIRVDGVVANPPVNHPSGVKIRKSGTSYVVSLQYWVTVHY